MGLYSRFFDAGTIDLRFVRPHGKLPFVQVLRASRYFEPLSVHQKPLRGRFMPNRLLQICLCVLILALAVRADTLKLKDGTSLDGKVIDQGTQYWIKDADGQTRLIDKEKVASWVHGS